MQFWLLSIWSKLKNLWNIWKLEWTESNLWRYSYLFSILIGRDDFNFLETEHSFLYHLYDFIYYLDLSLLFINFYIPNKILPCIHNVSKVSYFNFKEIQWHSLLNTYCITVHLKFNKICYFLYCDGERSQNTVLLASTQARI